MSLLTVVATRPAINGSEGNILTVAQSQGKGFDGAGRHFLQPPRRGVRRRIGSIVTDNFEGGHFEGGYTVPSLSDQRGAAIHGNDLRN